MYIDYLVLEYLSTIYSGGTSRGVESEDDEDEDDQVDIFNIIQKK